MNIITRLGLLRNKVHNKILRLRLKLMRNSKRNEYINKRLRNIPLKFESYDD